MKILTGLIKEIRQLVAELKGVLEVLSDFSFKGLIALALLLIPISLWLTGWPNW